MNRTLLLFLVLLGLGGLTYWMVKRDAQPESKSLTWEREFKVEANRIHKVFLYNKKTDSRSTLERRGDRWVVNGQYRVNPNIMQNFLGTLGNIQMNYVPGDAAIAPAVNTMATQGVYVQLFDANGQQIKAYTIGGNTADAQGTYALLDGSEQPHVVSLPFFNGNIRGLYALRDDQWRDKALADITPDRVRKLTVDYPKQRSSAFVIDRADDDRVTPLYPSTTRLGERPASGTVASYLEGFERLMSEAIINENPRRQEVTATLPFAIFTLEPTDGEPITLKFWPQIDPDREGALSVGDYERYFVEVTEGERTDFYAAQHLLMEKILRGYGYFYGS